MLLVEKHIFNKGSERFSSLDEICFLSKNLYNVGLYEIKKHFEDTGKWLRYNELEKKLRLSNNVDYFSIPNNSSQQTLMLLDTNIKSYFKALKQFKKSKTDFTGCPKFPNFKHKTKGRNIIVFTCNQFRLKEDGYIYFPKKSKISPLKTKIKKDIQQVRIIPRNNNYVIEIVYKFREVIKDSFNSNYLSIDMGVNNLATCYNTKCNESIVINGKPLKSINHYYNKKKSKLQSKLGFYLDRSGKKVQYSTSNKIKQLSNKRNNKVSNYIHKSTKAIVDYCLENNIDNIVLGKNKGWKQDINLGKKNNQTFVHIPFNMFESYLIYKSKKFGLNIIITEESYTSKCDSLALESLGKQETYLGKRVKRGLFQSSTNRLINADVNGALNILRKVIGDDFINLSNIGLVVKPIKVNLY